VSLRLPNAKYSTWWVHNLVAEAFIGERPKRAAVVHGLEGKSCNHIRNLSYLVLPNTNLSGIPHRFTNDEILDIWELSKTTRPDVIAKKYKSSTKTIWQIIRNDTYKNV